jgi:hypothetical protein
MDILAYSAYDVRLKERNEMSTGKSDPNEFRGLVVEPSIDDTVYPRESDCFPHDLLGLL